VKTSDKTESLTPGNALEKRIISFARNLLAVYGPYLLLFLLEGGGPGGLGALETLTLPLMFPIVILNAASYTWASWIAVLSILATCIYFQSKAVALALFILSILSILFLIDYIDALAHS